LLFDFGSDMPLAMEQDRRRKCREVTL
jgi:hypothetical protein